ncbi:hypothetical protein [Amycolatopsis vastitatis]|uniref:hypothetical protein n=1 Tax=Amycolatopsis vastitatis TaxID=1905142 RepID=UPI0013041239|nr:hypothetical protein [Amycolatopsis vastitatis]
MAKVIVAFSRDHTKIGKTVDVDDDEAAVMVNEGRARYAEDEPGKTEPRKAPAKAADK